MTFDIRTLSTLERTQSNLADLITACRVRGPLYCHDLELTNDVMRKAKGLQTVTELRRDYLWLGCAPELLGAPAAGALSLVHSEIGSVDQILRSPAVPRAK